MIKKQVKINLISLQDLVYCNGPWARWNLSFWFDFLSSDDIKIQKLQLWLILNTLRQKFSMFYSGQFTMYKN